MDSVTKLTLSQTWDRCAEATGQMGQPITADYGESVPFVPVSHCPTRGKLKTASKKSFSLSQKWDK